MILSVGSCERQKVCVVNPTVRYSRSWSGFYRPVSVYFCDNEDYTEADFEKWSLAKLIVYSFCEEKKADRISRLQFFF